MDGDYVAADAAVLLTDLQDGQVILGGKAYNADWNRRQIEDHCAASNIPDRSNRSQQHGFSRMLYERPNLIKRLFNKIKYFVSLATRYNKRGFSFLDRLKRTAIRLWFRYNESTA